MNGHPQSCKPFNIGVLDIIEAKNGEKHQVTINWVDRATREGTPLIDGTRITFVWEGDTPARIIGDFTGWSYGTPLDPIQADPGVWLYQLDVPDDAYLEYGFELQGERVPDRFNPRLVDNGFDGKMNNWLRMPRSATWNTSLTADISHGTLTEHTIGGVFTLGTPERTVYLYQPPVAEPVPLLVVLDGGEFLRRCQLALLVDQLIAQKRIRPLAMALVDSGGETRFVEYMCNDATIATLVDVVLPLAIRNLNLVEIMHDPGAFGILGASMGGLMALYTALRVPEIFGKVVSFSGSFGFNVNQRKTIIWEVVERFERRNLDIWMNVGRYEYLPANREMRDWLQRRGYQPSSREYSGGHNYTAWGDEAVLALESLFAP
jgi:enterochelin esterase family protein